MEFQRIYQRVTWILFLRPYYNEERDASYTRDDIQNTSLQSTYILLYFWATNSLRRKQIKFLWKAIHFKQSSHEYLIKIVLDRNSLFSAFVCQHFGGISIFVHLTGGWIQMTPMCPSISLSCNEALAGFLFLAGASQGRTQRYILGANAEAGEWEALLLCVD